MNYFPNGSPRVSYRTLVYSDKTAVASPSSGDDNMDGEGEDDDDDDSLSSDSSPQITDAYFQSLVWLVASHHHHHDHRIPDTFEPQWNEWASWMVPVENQGQCGSCWAFSTASCLTDRWNIWLRRRFFDRSLSPAVMTLCNDLLQEILENDPRALNSIRYPFAENLKTLSSEACLGNSLIVAILYLQWMGISPLACDPYDVDRYQFTMVQNYSGVSPSSQPSSSPSNDFSARYDDDNSSSSSSSYSSLTHLSRVHGADSVPSCYYYHSSKKPFIHCLGAIQPSSPGIVYASPAPKYQCLVSYTLDFSPCDPSSSHRPRRSAPPSREEIIRREIWKFGPVNSSFVVYEDFYEFDPSGPDAVYVHRPRSRSRSRNQEEEEEERSLGGHAVEIVGWGTITTTATTTDRPTSIPFWWIKNSFGPEYGREGYFRFLRGQNQCSLEENVICMIPNLWMDFEDHARVAAYVRRNFLESPIFRVNPAFSEREWIRIAQKAYRTFSDRAHVLETASTWEHLFPSFGTLSWNIVRRTSFFELDTPLRTGYSHRQFMEMPGLDYSAPSSLSLLPEDLVRFQCVVVVSPPLSLPSSPPSKHPPSSLMIITSIIILFSIVIAMIVTVIMLRKTIKNRE